MEVRLLGMDKHLGIIPVCICKTWRRCFVKCVLVVARPEAKEACRKEHLLEGLESRTEEGIQAMKLPWKKNSQKEYCKFVPVYV